MLSGVDENLAISNMEGSGDVSDGALDSGNKRKQPASKSSKKAKGGSKKARRSLANRDSEEYDEEKDGDAEEGDIDMDLEDADGEINDEAVEEEEEVNTRKKAGGIISAIYVENFMNHKKMEVHLNPTLTFITGKNGSGKSAIATALMICLGSRASLTGRGNSLSGLIMEGSNGNAKVRVSLKNTGEDAYQPHLYGKTIVIERTITKSGSSLALKNGSKLSATISTKRADLDRILIKFDIRVDNPCCVLTQEQSKKFIKGKDEDKYDFFMKATGLKPMWDELVDLDTTYRTSRSTYDSTEGMLTKLKEDYIAKKKDVDSMLDLNQMENQICQLHATALWIDVHSERLVVQQLQESTDKAEKAAKKAKEDLDSEEEAMNGAGNTKAQLKAELEEAVAAVEALDESAEGSQKEYDEIIKKKKDQRALEKAVSQKKTEYEEKKTEVLEELEEKKNKVRGNADAERKEKFDRKEKIQADIDKTKGQMSVCETQIQEAEDGMRDSKKLISRHNREKTTLERDLRELEIELRSARGGGAQAEVANFSLINNRGGKELYSAYTAIQKDPKLKGKLVGPLGKLLSLKPEAKRCSAAVHVALNGLESAFINVGKLDVMNRGHELFRKHNVRAMIINQPGYGNGRYSMHRANMDYGDANFALIDAVNIVHEDPAVCDLIYNVLIDRKSAHSTLLVPTEKAVMDYVIEDSRGKSSFKDKNHKQCIVMEGPFSTISYSGGNRGVAPFKAELKRYLSASSGNSADTVNEIQQSIEAKMAEIKEHDTIAPSAGSDRDLQVAKGEQKMLESRLRTLVKDLKTVKNEITDLDDASREEDTTQLESNLEQLGNLIDNAEYEHRKIKDEIKATNARYVELKKAVEEMDDKKRELSATSAAKEEELKKEMDRSRNAESQIHRLRKASDSKAGEAEKVKKRLDAYRDEYEKMEATVQSQTRELLGEAWDGGDIEPGQHDTKEKLKKKAEKKKESMEKQKEANAVSGLTLEIAEKRFKASKAAYKEAKESRNILLEQLSKLDSDLKDRKVAYKSHRKTCAERITCQFQDYLAKKNFTGRVHFIHSSHDEDKGKEVRGKLGMSVNKDGGEVEEGTNDIRNLSGGERSFVTLSLLLALGHVVDAPFRLMDEYDVFLDEFSRTVTLNQIQDYAKSVITGKKQYIVITPNSLKGITTGESTKVFKMPDPQRRTATGLQQQTID